MSKPNKEEYQSFKKIIENLKEAGRGHYLSVVEISLNGTLLSDWAKDALDSLKFYYNKKAP